MQVELVQSLKIELDKVLLMIFKGHLVFINDSPFLTEEYVLCLCKLFVFFFLLFLKFMDLDS